MMEVAKGELATWNAPQQVYPRNKCVPELVAAQAATMPDKVALIVGDRMLNYGELNRQANQLAYHLQMLGVQRDVLVGLCVERSLDMVVGLLGILKAGGAYVPLDPAYPPERLAFMLADAQISVLITQQHLTTRLPTDGVRMVCLDSDEAILAKQSEADPVPSPMVTDLAYVIYTSGSTGQPKGVEITHDSLLNLVFWHHHAFSVTPNDRATQVASMAF
ncbi:MAG: AMP-binding protein, partial [Ktedonobacteraceae bacterium]|nr:AMP-binding protein [Ktedonobacteraceae bacterium]